MIKSFVNLLSVDGGFRPENVLTFNLMPPLQKYPEPGQRARLFRRIHEAISAIPGVEASGGATSMPPAILQRRTNFAVAGLPELDADARAADYIAMTPAYFRALRVPLKAGRVFTEGDSGVTPLVVIINERFARRHFQNQDAIGRQIRLVNSEHSPDWRTIVGVVGDVHYFGLETPVSLSIYTPFDQTPWFGQYLVVRRRANPQSLTTAVQAATASVDPDLVPAEILPMEKVVARSVATPRFQMLLLGGFAALALLLAAVGIYGVISYSVIQRTHEIGVRIAVGAQASNVLRLMVGQGMILTMSGVVIGLAASFGLTRLMTSLLFGVAPTDPATFAGVAVLLSAVALAASYLPARRATRVDPLVALRYE